ncbi:hypothetical protein PAMA_012982 [Pampus argenteus]
MSRCSSGAVQDRHVETRPVTSHPGQRLTLGVVEPLIHNRLPNVKSAFMALDPDGTGLVRKEEFRRVLRSSLCVSQKQLNTLLDEVCEGSGATVDYMRFLRRFSRAPTAHRSCRSLSVRRGPQNSSMSLSEIQKHLKDKLSALWGNRPQLPQIKIRDNLRTVIRVFRLFDYNRGGRIQQHDFRRILDSYLIHLTDKEFQRLWNHYSPNNMATISYELFLDKLGFGNSHNFNIAPVCTKLEVSGRGTTPPEKGGPPEQRPESQSSSCVAPSVLPRRKLQTLFYDKMCINSTPVWQALQAFDITHSGLVKQDVLRAVLNSFIFPMNTHSFQKLTSRTSDQPSKDKDILALQHIYPQLREIFLQNRKDVGCITRADLRHLLERPGGSQPRTPQHRLPNSQITELLNVLDPEHSGVIQLASLERLYPSICSAPSPGNIAEPLDEDTGPTSTETEEQKTPDERQTTRWADKVCLASASWRTVENLLLEKLCEQLSSVLAALKLCDPQHTGYITPEDLRRILSHYDLPISNTHFNKLCESSSSSTPGSTSRLVSYSDLLRNLGAPLADESTSSSCCSHGRSYHTERPYTSAQSTLESVKSQQPPSSLQGGPDTCSILEIVFKRMQSRLHQRHTSLTDRIQAIIRSSDGMLSEADIRKILEDSWIILDDKNFNKFTELLGLTDGRIELAVFQEKYKEATARDGQQGSEGHDEKDDVVTLLTSAEQCLASMKTRIKIIHEDNLTAFRLMDRKRRGVVDRHDFNVLYNSLGFYCREEEYQRLLDLIGLQPGHNLNYAEFVNVVENNGKQGTQTATVQEQLHDLLACEARYKWADMSKVLCHFDTDGQGWIYKKSLRELLFTYTLPLRPAEFEQLWSRYDPEGQGSVAVCDFLERLGFHHDGELRSQSQTLKPTVAQKDAGRPVSSDSTSLECIEQVLQDNYKELSDALSRLETRGDDMVTVEELLHLLHTSSCFIQREQLIKHLHRLKVSMDENNRRISSMDLLSVFNHKAEKNHEPAPSSPEAMCQIESLDGLSPGMALARMQELVTASAPNLFKAFSAFDQGNTGTVQALDFRQVLENFCARLSDKQYRHMLTKVELNCKNNAVNWKDFLNKFKSQSSMISERCLRTREQAGQKNRSSGVSAVLQQIQEVVSGHLYEITKELMDLDHSDSTAISKEQFRQLCGRHCLRLTDNQFECVWSQMPVNEHGKLQFREFLKRFAALGGTAHTEAESPTNNIPPLSPEPRETPPATQSDCPNTAGAILQRTKSAPQCASRHRASAGRLGTASPLGSTERRLRGAVQRCWKEIQRNCSKEDPQQEGHISTVSFLEILQSLNVDLSPVQFEHLDMKFGIVNNGRVSYHNFLRHFLLNLRPAETKGMFERRKIPLPVTPMSQGVLSQDCVEVMLRIYEAVRSSWSSIRRSFLTSDRSRTGSVSVQDFRKVLRHFNVSLSEEEFFHLSSYFDANTAGKICYNSFLWAFLH